MPREESQYLPWHLFFRASIIRRSLSLQIYLSYSLHKSCLFTLGIYLLSAYNSLRFLNLAAFATTKPPNTAKSSSPTATVPRARYAKAKVIVRTFTDRTISGRGVISSREFSMDWARA